MTTKGHQWIKALAEPTYQRIIERGPWASYVRCDECGVDAGLACRDEHDRVALEVCDGRRLVIKRRGSPAGDCALCGVEVPMSRWACSIVSCDKPECITHAKRLRWRRDNSRKRVQTSVPCAWCGTLVVMTGGRARGRPCCGAIDCRRGLAREKAAERRRRFA